MENILVPAVLTRSDKYLGNPGRLDRHKVVGVDSSGEFTEDGVDRSDEAHGERMINKFWMRKMPRLLKFLRYTKRKTMPAA
jgi:hypothetical protein